MNLVPYKVKYLPPIIYFIVAAFDKSARISKHNEPVADGKPKIIATWHGRQYCFLKVIDRSLLNVLISKSNDGEIITTVLKRFGFKVIRGSASRGGMSAVRQMLEVLNINQSVAFTVDGPRGPAYIPKIGVVKLAQMSGVPIVPVIPSTKTKLVVKKSWDKYNLPVFFSKITYFYGDPIYVDPEASESEQEKIRLHLEQVMKKLTIDADKAYNVVEDDKSIFDNLKVEGDKF